MKFAFAGTPQFAAWVLRDLVEADAAPCLVVSQPDRPAGRGRHLREPAAIAQARSSGIPFLATGDINEVEVRGALREARAEALVVAAFGQLLRRDLLDAVPCLNVHASLLPSYRGAAPIARALMAGETETGVSIMRMTPGLDEGPWALQKRVGLSLRDDAADAGRVLALLGALATRQVLAGLEEGTVTWTEQVGPATYAAKLSRADRVLDLDVPARRAHDQVRALAPDTGVAIDLGLHVKILRTWPYPPGWVPDASPAFQQALVGVTDRPWRVAVANGRILLGCARGALEVLVLQPSGKRPMRAAEFLRGYGKHLEDRARSLPHDLEGGDRR
ncbi:MAG: formyltransferase family protein [Thermoleophilia bacterium]|nr:formyltransferase family protein [Thermoleophilia bacterium]